MQRSSQPRCGLRAGSRSDRRRVAESANRRIGRLLAHPADKVEFARLLKGQGRTPGEIAAKAGIPKTSLHRYLTAGAADQKT